MQMTKNLLLLLLAGGLATAGPLACSGTEQDPTEEENQVDQENQENQSNQNNQNNQNNEENQQDPETAAMPLHLKVVDHEGLPVEGASVMHNDQESISDADGIVILDAEEGDERYLAQISAEGFAHASADRPVHEVEADSGQIASATVRLLPLGRPIAFDAEQPADLTRDRVNITLPANALVDADGNPVTGEASATIISLDPTTDDMRFMPGPLMGLPEGGGDEVPLLSVMMSEITFWQDGEELQLADDQAAQISFLMPEELNDGYAEGDEIEFWHFDLAQARWVQEGKCVVAAEGDGLSAKCEALHLSWWNVDKPLDTRNCVEVTVIDSETGEPIPGASLNGYGIDFQGQAAPQGTTDANGLGCMDFMRDGTINLEAFHSDYFFQIGGFATVDGNDQAASCQDDNECLEVTVELSGESTCLAGEVLAADESPEEGATVWGTYETYSGVNSTTATSGADGSFCLDIPVGFDVDISALSQGQGAQASYSPDQQSQPDAACGDDSCEELDSLVLSDASVTCIQGHVEAYSSDPDIEDGPMADIPVFVFAGEVTRTCDGGQGPYDWGEIIAQGTTDANGEYALDIPMSFADDIFVHVGECDSQIGPECFNYGQLQYELSPVEASVTSGPCHDIETYTIYDQCFTE